MDHNKPRRPLPIPGARPSSPGQTPQRPGTPTATTAQRPSTPTAAPMPPLRSNTPTSTPSSLIKPTAVSASSFYADPRKNDSASRPSRHSSISEGASSTSANAEGPLQASTSETFMAKSEGRPPGVGSSSTTFTNIPISEDYRAPELIPEDDEPPSFSSVVSEYTSDPASDLNWPNQSKLGNQWGNQSGATAYPSLEWGEASTVSGWGNEGSSVAAAWDMPDASMKDNASDLSTSIAPKIPISSRCLEDELRWWDRENVRGRNFPGKGVLPVLMAESIENGLQRLLRNGSKGLYKVEITPPDLTPMEQRESNSEHPAHPISPSPSLTQSGSNKPLDPSSHAPSRPKSPRPRPPHVPPTPFEVQQAGKPHPDAYYSPKENAWVLLSWKDSSSSPLSTGDPLPIFASEAGMYVRPRTENRMESDGMGVNCLAYMTESGGQQNQRCHDLTHHFHKYPRSIDGKKLNPPVRDWRDDFLIDGSDRGDLITATMDVDGTTSTDSIKSITDANVDQPILLDSYVCCQCSFYLVVSSPSPSSTHPPGPDSLPNVIPGIIPLQTWKAYVNDRLENPNMSMSKEQTLLGGLETLLIIIQNHLWKGESRNIKVNGKGFSRRLGWGNWIQSILRTLSFHAETHKNPANPQTIDTFLRGPVITPTTTQGRLNRRRLIRAWVEISSWIATWKEREEIGRTLAPSYKELELWTKLNPDGASVREMYQRAIGAHFEQIPRLDLPTAILDNIRSKEVSDKFMILGLTPTAWTADLLCFAYLAQIRCDPAHTPTYFGALQLIMNALVQLSSISEFRIAFVNSRTGNENRNDIAKINSGLSTSTSRSSNSATSINLELLTNLYVHEDTRGRWSEEILVNAIETLGFTYTGAFREATCGWLNMEWDGDLVRKADSGDAGDDDRLLWKTDVHYTSEELEGSIPDEFIAKAWRVSAKRDSNASSGGDVDMNSHDGQSGGDARNNYTDALRIVAESRGSYHLIDLWRNATRTGSGGVDGGYGADVNWTIDWNGGYNGGYNAGGETMTIVDAYQALEVPSEIDDAMLITVYQMRIEDSPLQLAKMQRALQFISEARNSDRLREFARTMRDPGEIITPTRADWPRGLNQLGNTCYLNSLLQYFYTIKELRSSIITMASMSGMNIAGKGTNGGEKDKASSDTIPSDHSRTLETVEYPSKAKLLEDVTDDDLKRHRVGGRLVTRREIVRSKKFVSHLADLFHKLEYADHPSVTPSIELAKLALVTSKDEEEELEDESNKAGTDSSHDTDATLVEDLPPRPSHPPPYQSSADSTSSRTERPHRTDSPSSISSSLPTSPHSSHSSLPNPTGSPSSVLGKRPRDTLVAGLSREDTELLDGPSLRASSSASPPPSSVVSLASLSRESSRASEGPPPLVSISERDQRGQSEDVVMHDASPIRELRELPKLQHPPPLPPRKLPLAHNESVMMFGKQHDVAECMDNCMFQIETALLKFHGHSGEGSDDTALDDPDKTSVVKRLFYGKIRQTFTETLKGEPTKHQKEDLFSHLPVNVGDEVDLLDRGTEPPPYEAAISFLDNDPPKDLKEFSTFDIYDGLGRYFDDTIEYEGQKVSMEVGLVKLPPLLQVQLQRVQFNRELLQSWKSQAYVKFGETLYMDRFMDAADPERRRQSKEIQDELNTCRERLKLLTKGKSNDALQTASTFLSSSGSFLSSLSIPVTEWQLSSLSSEQKHVQNEIHRLRIQIPQLKAKLEALWADSKEVQYELTSVFIHRGSSPSFGHYFFYSRNLPDKPDVWFKYNDEEVSEVGKEEVFRDTTGETANPYLLVFARKGSQVVETVNRFDPALLDNDDAP